MVYLNNDTNQQEVWIPRNDGLGTTHKSSYDQGFEDGYASGETHQKNLLTTTAFTENGEYSRENGWSAVTVSVPGSTARLEAKNVTITADTTNILPSSGYDGMSAVTVDASEYGQSNYDSGFDDGFEDGYSSGSTEQKELLTTTAFTENGSYTRENGWSGVSVNVDTASTYSSGYTDGQDSIISTFSSMTATTNGQYGSSAHPYTAVTVNVHQTGTSATLEEKDVVVTGVSMTVNPSHGFDGMSKVNLDALGLTGQYWQSGHTQGIEDQKMLLSSAEFSANGVYNRANGWDRVTVNVPQTGSTAVLGTGSFSANGSYSASTDNFDGYSAVTVSIDTASTWNSGYTSGHTDGVNEEKAKMSAVTFTANTAVTLADGSYSAVTVNVPQTGSSAVLGTKTITANGTYSASTDSLDGYSAVTVNVPQGSPGVKYVEYLETDGSEISWDTGVKLEDLNEIVYFDFAPLTGTATGDAYFPFLSQQYEDDRWNLAIRTIGMGYNVNDYMQTIYGDGRQFIAYSVGNKNVCVISLTGATVNGVDYLQQSTGLYTVDWNIIINGQKKSDGFMRFPVGRYYGFKIMSGNNAVIDLKPALDGNDVPCFFDEVSKTYIYHIGSGTPISGPAIPSSDYISGFTDGYASGFTDGYNSGYTDGQDSIISTFTSMTATTNGIYGSSAHPLSSITVDVQTVDYGELIGLYCTNNCQFVLRYKQYLENTSIQFGIRTGGASINITSGATAPSVNRIEVDSNGNVTGHSYSSAGGAGAYATGSGQTSVVLDAFPTKNYMVIETGVKNTTRVNNSSASTCINYSSTPANNLLLSIDDGYFYGGAINNTGADYQSCIFPHVDNDGNACILGSYGLFYPISGECYPIYKNGNNYYVLMKTQPWNQQ